MNKLVAALVLTTCSLGAQAQSLNGRPFIAVQGHAELEVVPDTFPVTVTLSETNVDAAAAQRIVEDLATRVVDAAEKMKVADRDIRVGNLDIDAATRYDQKTEEDVFIGNTYERVIRVAFHSLPDLKQFIGSLPAGKNVRVETAIFTFSKEQQAKAELTEKAIVDAKLRAEMMVKAVGKRLLELHNVSDRSQGVTYSSYGYSAASVTDNISQVALLSPGTVKGAKIVLREGIVKLQADAYLVYLIGD